jgi:N-acetylneuraminic acid mutarotase
LNTGGRYSVATNSWRATSMTNAPSGRYQHTAVWTGGEMIVWGGSRYYMYPNTGGRYNPGTNSWTPTSAANAPVGRENHTAVWTGSKMIVWGGDYFYNSAYHFLNTGSKYNPVTNRWAATSTANAPAGRDSHTAVWTGSQMIVWGGENRVVLNTGGRYCAPTPSPTPTATPNT